MNLHEPATFLTDGLLGGLALYLAWRLQPTAPAVRQWRYTFLLTGLSALVGGAWHGFAPDFPVAIQTAWWVLTLWLISGVSACLALSLMQEWAPAAHQPRWRRLIGLKFALAVVTAAVWPVFVVAIVDYGLALAAWLLAALITHRAWRGRMLAGISLAVSAALIQQSGWPRLRYFNHNDLYHLIQALALVAFFQAVRRLGVNDKFRSRLA